ncbi:MAG TPA: nuclear transport factor 2 family protein [Flavitalea sp.]|nr:nuclear transport factor 2 family protein [Flavitalea sp.]
MKRIIAISFLLFSGTIVSAQTVEDSIKATINQLFTAMKEGDSAKLTDAFADSAILQTIGNRAGKIFIRNESVLAFASSIKTLPKGAADERITFETVKIDGPLALVWTPYQFYFQEKFSHCGVNSFHLVRLNGKWKIQYLIDTRRKEPCK